jgi:zinc/manganese transport system substrate-binding protein
VAGDDATVEVLVPRGADPHGYQPSSRDVARLQSADLVIANGLGLEEGLSDVLDAAAAEGAVVIEVAPLLDPLPFVEDGVVGDDPHVWMDPSRVAAGAGLIADSLRTIDPSIPWSDRAEAYAAELDTADAEIVAILDAVPDDRRVLVTNHDAFGYFAERYDFTVLGVVIPGGSTLADPSSAELATLITDMSDAGVTVIFTETSAPTALADAVAAELGTDVSVVSLLTGSLGPEGSSTGTLIGMLTTNAEMIASALAATGS